MRYDPHSATESSGSAAPGTYYFTVANAEEQISATSKNEMLKLTLSVDPGNGVSISIYDYLVNTPGGLWKAKMFCAEVGLDFDTGELTVESCLGRSGKAVFAFDKSDLAKVKAGTLKRAYLKVERYGVHGEKPTAGAGVPPPAQHATPENSNDPPPTGEEIPF